jgi:hypothetical protein
MVEAPDERRDRQREAGKNGRAFLNQLLRKKCIQSGEKSKPK